jgi:hypothetical protein
MLLKETQLKLKLVLLVQALLLVIGAIVGNLEKVNRYFDMPVSFLFILTALYLYTKKKNTYTKFAAIAMIFCFLGDMILSKFIPGNTMLGMGMFAVAHIFFIIGYTKTIKEKQGKIINKNFIIAIILYCTYFISVWNMFLRYTDKGSTFAIASLIYGLLICAMASIAVSLYKNGREYLKAAAGAFMFVLSDTLIAVTLTTTVPYSDLIIWITYVLALYGVIHSDVSQL